MRKTITWNGRTAIMDACRRCGIGCGITVYPDGVVFHHAERRLVDGLCDDCRAWEHRRLNGNGVRAPIATPARRA